MFLHQDGLMLCLFVEALEQRHLLAHVNAHGPATVVMLAAEGSCNPAYLHVALRTLAQGGWLTRSGVAGSAELTYSMTALGQLSMRWSALYRRVAQFVLAHAMFDEQSLQSGSPGARELEFLTSQARAGWTQQHESMPVHLCEHLTGALLIPLLIGLWRIGKLDTLCAYARNDRAFAGVLEWFAHLGWIDPRRESWTTRGHLLRAHVLQYGLVGSYLPMLQTLPGLLYGGVQQNTHVPEVARESHVDRRLNVLASAHAHQRYFADADDLITTIFDAEPLQEQPRFVLDVGCGDGSWLQHIHELIRTRTRRGRHLREHPVLMIGADYNSVALDIAARAWASAAMPALTLQADVSDPDALAGRLAVLGLRMQDGLHIRAFIDHNRVYQPPQGATHEPGPASLSSGAYIDAAGNAIANHDLIAELGEFLQRWQPHLGRHGLVMLEAHCVDPAMTSRHAGRSHSLAFDAYHALSHQYPVDFNVFMEAAATAGLAAILHEQKRYPARAPFVAISLNRFVPRAAASLTAGGDEVTQPMNRGEWRPRGDEDLQDGRALHELLYRDCGIDSPRAWCGPATGALVSRVLQRIHARLDAASGWPTRTLRVLDYGAGTGLFSIELLKALQHSGLSSRLRRDGIEFELGLADIPSGWFAHGYELLRASPHTRFYSMRDASGFVRLSEGIAHRFDIAVVSMVFHLIPPAALDAVAENLADVLHEHGALLWSAPDIGPSSPSSVLFHEANRQLRSHVLAYLEQPQLLREWLEQLPVDIRQPYADVPEALARAHLTLMPQARHAARRAAERQVLRQSNTMSQLNAALNRRFVGEVHTRCFEMKPAEALAAILVPSNQRMLAEIEDLQLRRRVTELVMTHEVLPRLCAGSASTSDGYAVHWTFGEHDLSRPVAGEAQRS